MVPHAWSSRNARCVSPVHFIPMSSPRSVQLIQIVLVPAAMHVPVRDKKTSGFEAVLNHFWGLGMHTQVDNPNVGQYISHLKLKERAECKNCETVLVGALEVHTYQPQHTSGTQKTLCLQQPICVPGQYLSGGPNPNTSVKQSCEACQAANFKYTDKLQHQDSNCTLQPRCGKGEKLAGQSIAMKEECVGCGEFEYMEKEEHHEVSCKTHPTCGKDQYLAGATSTTNGTCVQQPACPLNQYLAGGRTTKAGTCVPCINVECGGGRYQSGSCSGKTNGFKCNTCSHQDCGPGQYRNGTCSGNIDGFQCKPCSNQNCAPGQYRSGFCSFTANAYTCNSQPTCGEDQYLAGATPTTKGTCVQQPACPLNQYLAGSSTMKEGTCVPCINVECGGGRYQSGSCSGKTNGFKCNMCSHQDCGPGQYRNGTCSGNIDGFQCKPCSNQNCAAGQYRSGVCSLTRTATAATPSRLVDLASTSTVLPLH